MKHFVTTEWRALVAMVKSLGGWLAMRWQAFKDELQNDVVRDHERGQ